jgi:hypothetical protein
MSLTAKFQHGHHLNFIKENIIGGENRHNSSNLNHIKVEVYQQFENPT